VSCPIVPHAAVPETRLELSARLLQDFASYELASWVEGELDRSTREKHTLDHMLLIPAREVFRFFLCRRGPFDARTPSLCISRTWF